MANIITKYFRTEFLAFLAVLILFTPAISFAAGWTQTGEPCNREVTTAEDGPDSVDTVCPFLFNGPSTSVILNWDLTNRGGIPNPLCFVECTKDSSTCRSYNHKEDGLLKNYITEWNLGIKDVAAVSRPEKNERYQVICCEKDTSFTGVIPRCKGAERVKSKKFWITTSSGWGSCSTRPGVLYLTEPTTIGRAIVSITTVVKQTLLVGADPVGCVGKVTQNFCDLTLEKWGPAGQFLSREAVYNIQDLTSRILANTLSPVQLFLVRSSCRAAGVAVKVTETRITKTSI